MIGTLALALTIGAAHRTSAVHRLVSSAHGFQQQFQALKSAGTSLSPLQRLVFSLMLANSETAPRHS